jgi:predicted PurR-regulated permease PerM
MVSAYFVIVHVIEGDVIGPRIMGRAVGIHPATGLIALVAGTELFGILGRVVRRPLAGLIQAIVTAAWISNWRELASEYRASELRPMSRRAAKPASLPEAPAQTRVGRRPPERHAAVQS